MRQKVFVIAEAGVNHNGDLSIAKQLIQVAKDAGADAIKFQTFTAEKLASGLAPKAKYQLETTDSGESQLMMLKKLELPYGEHAGLKKYAEEIGIEFMSTPFDIEAASFLKELGVKRFKIPSGEITNFPFLKHVASLGLPTIFSTGMSTLDEIRACLDVLCRFGLSKDLITVLHCNTEYPTPLEDVNLRAMNTIGNEFGVNFGYSDHTAGTSVSVIAAALGAHVIEKHFTTSRALPGPDQKASLEPAELKQMISEIRDVEKMLGSSEKKQTPSEIKNLVIARKSIVAAKAIQKGEVFSEQNLTTKRPGDGVSPMDWERYIGQPSARSYLPDELIEKQ